MREKEVGADLGNTIVKDIKIGADQGNTIVKDIKMRGKTGKCIVVIDIKRENDYNIFNDNLL